MPLISGSTTVNTPFTPLQGAFRASNGSSGAVLLQVQYDGAGNWFFLGEIPSLVTLDVPNPSAGASYRYAWRSTPPTTISLQANQ
jgi:hypothetical protein